MNSTTSKTKTTGESNKNQKYWSIIWRSIAPNKKKTKMNPSDLEEIRKTLLKKKLTQIREAT
jgi:hypothetical protein